VLRHYFPGYLTWLKAVRDPRQRPEACTFPIEYILMTVLLMHCGQCGSRRQLGRELRGGRLGSNIWRLVGKAHRHLACHPDTVNGVLEVLDPEQVEILIAEVFRRLRRARVLDRFRFNGKLVCAIDGTKVLSFKSRHCEHCTHQTQKGVTTYFHYVLAAKIVTPLGLVVPLAVTFIENPAGEFDKQDCEIKAWRRLYQKIQRLYPRLPLNLVGDGLYAEETTFACCEQAGWDFYITLPEDKLPSVTAQLPPAAEQWTGTRTEQRVNKQGKLRRTVRWQTPVRYHGEILHVIELEETNDAGERVYYNRWATNVKPDYQNAFDLAQTGRLRWKIENEGTNTQKNGGYEMGHAYGRNQNAWKNYYLLLQLSQLLNDLVRFGDYIQKSTADPQASFASVFETMHNFAKRLIEHLRRAPLQLDDAAPTRDIQVRLLRC